VTRLPKAFTCRIQQRHNDSLYDSPNAELFKKLRNSKSAWLSEGDETWTCEPCNVDNKIDKKRCFLCMRWKDGKRANFVKRDSKATTSQVESILETNCSLDDTDDTKKPKAPGVPKEKCGKRKSLIRARTKGITAKVNSESEATLFCGSCNVQNKIGRKRCSSCMRWKGGKRDKFIRVGSISSKSRNRDNYIVPVDESMSLRGGNQENNISAESPWICEPCDVENKPGKKRCCLCMRWRDGRHPVKARRIVTVTKNCVADENPEKIYSERSVEVKAPSESIVTVMKGNSPGTAKMWECKACFHVNHWRKYSCCSCGRRSGGRALEIAWPSGAVTAVVSPSPSPISTTSHSLYSGASEPPSSAAPSRKRKKRSKSADPDEWTCHRCALRNNGYSLLCGGCFASRKSRSSRRR